MEKDKRIDGEYDPKYCFNSNPSKKDKDEAQKVIEKLIKNKSAQNEYCK